MREPLGTFWPDVEDDETRNFTFALLAGERIVKAVGKVGDKHLLLYLENERVVYMYHPQDCCESVDLADIVGDVADLQDALVVSAEVTSNTPEDGSEEPRFWAYSNTPDGDSEESRLWTYYNIQTNKGHVQLRWFGSSNGYYSEEVDCILVKGEDVKMLEKRLAL